MSVLCDGKTIFVIVIFLTLLVRDDPREEKESSQFCGFLSIVRHERSRQKDLFIKHMVCIQKICPKILRDHLAVQAPSIDSLGK